MPDLRPADGTDPAAVHRLIRRAEVHDRAPVVTALEEVADIFRDPHLDPAADTRICVVDGEVVAWGWVMHHPAGERLERAMLLGAVDPVHRRRGIGSALFEWQIARAEELLRRHPPHLPRVMWTYVFDTQADAIALYEGYGFRPVRWNESLLRPLDGLPGGSDPAAIEIVPWDRARDEEVRRVKNAAFADHWRSPPTDPASWVVWLEEHATRLDLSLLVLSEGEVIGYSLNEHYPDDEGLTGRREGWIGNLGVLREWRRRGVASALIRRSMLLFREAGFTHAAIGVDTENPTGAARLYRRLGFVPIHRSVIHEWMLGGGRRPGQSAAGPRDHPTTTVTRGGEGTTAAGARTAFAAGNGAGAGAGAGAVCAGAAGAAASGSGMPAAQALTTATVSGLATTPWAGAPVIAWVSASASTSAGVTSHPAE
jgi:ribosomal protein S18 acetylase RimI-like enzyme